MGVTVEYYDSADGKSKFGPRLELHTTEETTATVDGFRFDTIKVNWWCNSSEHKRAIVVDAIQRNEYDDKDFVNRLEVISNHDFELKKALTYLNQNITIEQ